MEKLKITIDGRQFTDLEGLARHAAPALAEHSNIWWNGGLDSLDDILNHIAGELRIVWQHSDLSRHCLGHWAMVNWLADNLKYCHPTNVHSLAERLRQARLCEGPTLFEWLVEIIRSHEPVELVLE